MSESLLIVSIAFPTIFFLLFVVFGPLAYKKKNDKKYDFLTNFPYELMANEAEPLEILTVIFYDAFLFSLSLLAIYQVMVNYQSSRLISFILLGGFFALAFAISMISLGLTPASKEKSHTTKFVISSALLLCYNFINGIFLFAVSKGYKAMVAMNVFGALCFVVSLATFVIMLNPKLKNWPNLESVSEKDGTISYRRPRPFVLAFSEWGILLLTIVGYLFAAIGNALILL